LTCNLSPSLANVAQTRPLTPFTPPLSTTSINALGLGVSDSYLLAKKKKSKELEKKNVGNCSPVAC